MKAPVAAVGGLPEQGMFATHRRQTTQRVVALRKFEFHDLGAHFNAQRRRKQPGKHCGHIQDSDPLQWIA
jgi:hypothetical protein